MKTINQIIKDAYEKAEARGWDKIYWAIDIHDTIMRSSYKPDFKGDLYRWAEIALKDILKHPESRIVLWSSMSPYDLKSHKGYIFGKILSENPEYADRIYLNENPEEGDTLYARFNQKFYFNILLDDKAGFDGTRDWFEVIVGLEDHRRPLIAQ